MKAKAISFTPEVLKAKLRALEKYGRAQTRRPIRPAPPSADAVVAKSGSTFSIFTDKHQPDRFRVAGPVWAVRELMGIEPQWRPLFGLPGQRLWVRERARVLELNGLGQWMRLRYEVDDVESGRVPWPERLKPPRVGRCIPNGVHREGARHFLEVVEVKAERVSEISEQDVLLDGIQRFGSGWTFNGGLHLERTPQASYFALYDSIYGAGVHAKDWCWVYTLKRAEP